FLCAQQLPHRPSLPTRRSSDLGIKVTPSTRLYVTFLSKAGGDSPFKGSGVRKEAKEPLKIPYISPEKDFKILQASNTEICSVLRSEEHTSELQSRENLVCRLLL